MMELLTALKLFTEADNAVTIEGLQQQVELLRKANLQVLACLIVVSVVFVIVTIATFIELYLSERKVKKLRAKVDQIELTLKKTIDRLYVRLEQNDDSLRKASALYEQQQGAVPE